MKIATWNVNSVRARTETIVKWLDLAQPDIACFQEIKCQDEQFPKDAFEALGYNCAIHGQKSYNGVAILSKAPIEDVTAGLPGDDTDEQARYLEAVISTDGGIVRVATIYLPNGNPIGPGRDSDKFTYKLAWMERLRAHAQELLALEEPLVLGGDYNVIPTGRDVHDPEAWAGDALFQPETHARFREVLNLGLTDALRACTGQAGLYTFWDYQGGAWQKNHGILIDHLLLSPEAANHLTGCQIDKAPRAWEKPSDHVPVVAEFAF